MHFVYTQRERERRFFVAFYSNRYRVQAGARNTKRNWKRGGAMSYKYIDIPKKSMRIPLANWFWVFYLSLLFVSFFLFVLLTFCVSDFWLFRHIIETGTMHTDTNIPPDNSFNYFGYVFCIRVYLLSAQTPVVWFIYHKHNNNNNNKIEPLRSNTHWMSYNVHKKYEILYQDRKPMLFHIFSSCWCKNDEHWTTKKTQTFEVISLLSACMCMCVTRDIL